MKKSIVLLAGLVFYGALTGCNSDPAVVEPKPPASPAEMKGPVGLSAEEIQALRSKDSVVLSDELKRRLIASSNQLKLTPEEMQVLKKTGKVILCGRCGYILGEKKYNEAKARGRVISIDKKTGFAKDSLRERIIKLEGD